MFLRMEVTEGYTVEDALASMDDVPAALYVLPDDMVSLAEVVEFVRSWGDTAIASPNGGQMLAKAFAQSIADRFGAA